MASRTEFPTARTIKQEALSLRSDSKVRFLFRRGAGVAIGRALRSGVVGGNGCRHYLILTGVIICVHGLDMSRRI